MNQRIPGAPNMPATTPAMVRPPQSPVRRANTLVLEETVDRGQQNFHHAALVTVDSEWSSICKITEIMPYVLIGGYQNALDTALLKRHNVRFVISLLKGARKTAETIAAYRAAGIVHLRHFDVENEAGESLADVFRETYPLITQCVNAKSNVLVHCAQGVSTAPAIVAYYTIKKFYSTQRSSQNTLSLVIDRIRAKRPCVDINIGFIEQLEDAEAEMSGRAVTPQTSLSQRRNPALREKINAAILATTLAERKDASRG